MSFSGNLQFRILFSYVALYISVRLPRINHWMRGLDKAYVVHKWTGIVSTILIVFHWLGEKAPEWLVELGVIADPGELTDGSGFSELEIDLFQSGVFLVEWAFYILIILVVIALFRKVPYRLFRKSHKIFPVVFLIAAYHGATAPLKERWFDNLVGYILLLMLMTIGVAAALIALFQKIGASRKTTAVIDQIEHHESGILDIQLTAQEKPFLHKPGQYAFLRFAHDNEPHPFTIASSGDGKRLRFAIKELGDATTGLGHRLRVGQPVNVEDPTARLILMAQASGRFGWPGASVSLRFWPV